jgi:hypothetical protein
MIGDDRLIPDQDKIACALAVAVVQIHFSIIVIVPAIRTDLLTEYKRRRESENQKKIS